MRPNPRLLRDGRERPAATHDPEDCAYTANRIRVNKCILVSVAGTLGNFKASPYETIRWRFFEPGPDVQLRLANQMALALQNLLPVFKPES